MSESVKDSDDDTVFLKEIPAAVLRATKKPKIEGEASGSAGEEAVGDWRSSFQCVPWPVVDEGLDFYRKQDHVENMNKAGILPFLSASFVSHNVRDELVADFVASYNLSERAGIVQGKRVQLTPELVGCALKLPNFGISCKSLKQEDYPIGRCFSTEAVAIPIGEQEGIPIQFRKDQLTSNWREVVEFVSRWLFLEVDPNWVGLGAVVAAVAVFQHGVSVNWAKWVTRRLHKSIEDVKANLLDSAKQFCGGYYLTTIFDQVKPGDISKVKTEAEEGTSQFVAGVGRAPLKDTLYYQRKLQEASQLQMLATHPTIFEDYKALKEQHKVLEEKQSILQKDYELLQAESDTLKAAMSKPISENPEYVELQNQLETCRVEKEGQTKKLGNFRSQLLKSRLEVESQKQAFESITKKYEELEASHQHLTTKLSNRKGKEIGNSDDEVDNLGHEERGVPLHGLLELSTYIPPASNLEHAYTYDRQVFFLIADLVQQQYLFIDHFKRVWKVAEELEQEDLLVEIIVRGDLRLEDYVAAFWVIGDLGARLLRYYRQMEEVQLGRYQWQAQFGECVREPDVTNWGEVVAARLANNWEECPIEGWMCLLGRFLREFETHEWVIMMVKDCQARLTRSRFTDVHPSEYFHTYRDVKVRLERMVVAKSFSQLLPFEIDAQAKFKNKYNWQVAPEAIVGMPPHLDIWSCSTLSSVSDDQFLGKWENLFGKVSDRSDTLLWEALLWIGKDYNHEHPPLIKSIEALVAGEANLRMGDGEVPERVADNMNWCRSERRYKWRIDAQLDTVWYNWPVIPGTWRNSQECVTSYTNFWSVHKGHRDPVCFRAAIFCKALAEWCQFFNIIIDPRLGSRMLQDGELYARLNYNCCRKMRLMELMFMMQFLQGAHNNLIGDKSSNRKGVLDSFLNRDHTGLKRERQSWRDLSEKCDKANQEARSRGATRPLFRMPLQWSPGCDIQMIPYAESVKSARGETGQKSARGETGQKSARGETGQSSLKK